MCLFTLDILFLNRLMKRSVNFNWKVKRTDDSDFEYFFVQSCGS